MTQPAAFDLDLSIDLAAELRSITERQHLNQVHYAVALVRHAIALRPTRIDVRLRRGRFELSHDGAPLPDDEVRLLLEVTDEAGGESRQAALSELEKRYGVTLLSTLITSRRVTLDGARALSARGGRVRLAPPSSRRGYRVVVEREGRKPRDERRELRFYCRHADVPIFLNGRRINRALKLGATLLPRRFTADAGKGELGLPAGGSLARVRYFQHGIYFGVRQQLPSDGLPVEGAFDCQLFGYDENFGEAVHQANGAVKAAKRGLLDELPHRFDELGISERERIKALLLGMRGERLTAGARAVPIFHTSSEPWRLSLRDLEGAARRRGFIAYLRRPETDDRQLPILTPAEAAAVARLLGLPARRALPAVRPAAGATSSAGRPIASESLSAIERALIRAVSAQLSELRLVLTDGGHAHLARGRRGRTLSVPRTSPRLAQALAAYSERPQDVDAIALSLFPD
jgi:hypothetical protein